MNKTSRRLFAVAVLSGAAIGFYFWQQPMAPEPQLLQPVETPRPPAPAVVEPAQHYPIPEPQEAQAEQTLPSLDESDSTIWNALAGLSGQTPVKKLFHPQEIVRRIVVTIDNLPRKTVAMRLLPPKPVDGKFLTARQAESLSIAPENSARYTPYVRLAETVDAKKLTALYVRFYPLFQRAYQDLGYPDRYFNDRLVTVIDHLLAAPEVDAPLALVQPHILYKFENPDLEARSAGHKILLRMGSGNAAKIKAKLREIRSELIGGIPAR